MKALADQSRFLERALARLATAYGRGDEAAFDAALADVLARRAESGTGMPAVMLESLRRITRDLQGALERFSIDSRLIDYARREMPNARARLEQVLGLTEAAAHRTLDLIERSGPPLATVATSARALQKRLREGDSPAAAELDALLGQTIRDMDEVRGNLAEALLAQEYQDLTGQIIRSVMELVRELEQALGELWRLGGGRPDGSRLGSREDPRGSGPAVPGVNDASRLHAQRDVDNLLSDLGV
jgi:chemotaxis protein CheZ